VGTAVHDLAGQHAAAVVLRRAVLSTNHFRELTLTLSRDTLFHVEVMMERQNITLSLPKDTLLRVKLIAVKRQSSVSGLLTQTLERLVEAEDSYVHARWRHLEWLEHGVDLGTAGHISVGRDELHVRQCHSESRQTVAPRGRSADHC
jgi:tryptophan 2,3-dioxygenase